MCGKSKSIKKGRLCCKLVIPRERCALYTILGFTLEAKLDWNKHLTQVHLEISGRTLQTLASHLMTKYISWRIFTVKSVMRITNAIVRQQNWEEMHIVADSTKIESNLSHDKLHWANSLKFWVIGVTLPGMDVIGTFSISKMCRTKAYWCMMAGTYIHVFWSSTARTRWSK